MRIIRAQADALEIQAAANRRLADEYDAAQERGEVAKNGQPSRSMLEQLPTAADIGLSRKDIHEARQIRDAEAAEPQIFHPGMFEKLFPSGIDLERGGKFADPIDPKSCRRR